MKYPTLSRFTTHNFEFNSGKEKRVSTLLLHCNNNEFTARQNSKRLRDIHKLQFDPTILQGACRGVFKRLTSLMLKNFANPSQPIALNVLHQTSEIYLIVWDTVSSIPADWGPEFKSRLGHECSFELFIQLIHDTVSSPFTWQHHLHSFVIICPTIPLIVRMYTVKTNSFFFLLIFISELKF